MWRSRALRLRSRGVLDPPIRRSLRLLQLRVHSHGHCCLSNLSVESLFKVHHLGVEYAGHMIHTIGDTGLDCVDMEWNRSSCSVHQSKTRRSSHRELRNVGLGLERIRSWPSSPSNKLLGCARAAVRTHVGDDGPDA